MRFWHAVAFLEPEHVFEVAKACDALGYHGITVSEHFFYPRQYRSKYPYSHDGSPMWSADTPWPEPWALISAMGAITQNIHFTTNVYVAPARDLFTVAKLVSTAAVLTNGRVAMGVGPGWCEDEFLQSGQDFGSRGKRLDEMIPVLRKLWTGQWTEHHGAFFDFPELRIAPVPADPIPVYIGGHSTAALRRAARLGDGWIGAAYQPDEADVHLEALRSELKAAGHGTDGFEVVLGLMVMPDADTYKRWEDKGVTGLLCAPWMTAPPNLDDRLRAIEQFAKDVIAKMR
jgi:probable F420-dependent oxidoreductase